MNVCESGEEEQNAVKEETDVGLFKSFVSQTRKPEGFLGKMMLRSMNSGHAQMADWGLSHLPGLDADEIVDLGCGGGRNAGELLRRYRRFPWRRRRNTTRA